MKTKIIVKWHETAAAGKDLILAIIMECDFCEIKFMVKQSDLLTFFFLSRAHDVVPFFYEDDSVKEEP